MLYHDFIVNGYCTFEFNIVLAGTCTFPKSHTHSTPLKNLTLIVCASFGALYLLNVWWEPGFQHLQCVENSCICISPRTSTSWDLYLKSYFSVSDFLFKSIINTDDKYYHVRMIYAILQ